MFLGSAEHDNGIKRLLKARRHETPNLDKTSERLVIPTDGEGFAATIG